MVKIKGVDIKNNKKNSHKLCGRKREEVKKRSKEYRA